MRKLRIVIAITFAMSLNIEVIAQATNASLTGTVTDITGATVEDVVVTARNIKTGVAQDTKTNGRGIYQFPSLQPGVYEVSAEKSGFRRFAYNDVALEVAAKERSLPLNALVARHNLKVPLGMQISPLALEHLRERSERD